MDETDDEVDEVECSEEENGGSEAAPAPLVVCVFCIGVGEEEEQDCDDGCQG